MVPHYPPTWGSPIAVFICTDVRNADKVDNIDYS